MDVSVSTHATLFVDDWQVRRTAQVSPTTLTMDAAAYEELRRAAFSVGRWVSPRRPERPSNRAARRRAAALRRA